MVLGDRRERDLGEEEDIGKEEVIKTIKKLRDGKVAEGDGIPVELWKHERKQIQEWV